MLKSEITNRLNTALAFLDEAAGTTGRLTKGAREKYAAFTSETREALARSETAGGGEPSRMVWRLATIESPVSKKSITLELKRDGSLSPSDTKRLGIKAVDSWTEVRARSRREAVQKIAEGEGTPMERVKGKVRAAHSGTVDK
jgi:hypothetical protein